MRFFEILVEGLFWLAIFISPFIVGVIAAAVIYFRTGSFVWASIPFVTGAIAGVWLAERIRRKYGCANFFGRLRG